MRSIARDLALGLAIGMSGTALVVLGIFFSGAVTGMTPSGVGTSTVTVIPSETAAHPTPPPTSTIASTLTPIPILANVPATPTDAAPTATHTPDPVLAAINSGDLIFTGPLSNAHQVAVYRSSLYYVGATARQSKVIAKQINGVGYGDPTNICGPLAIAIMRDAGLVNPEITPHDFWLLDPNATTDKRFLTEAFPTDRFVHSKVETPINKVNWRETPLVPGDFLFIWHGSGGNFDHMLVVSRVDNGLRTYAVTNFGASDGYIIAEALLYDPNDPNAGLFHTWTKERQAILGSTGFGGYELWRSVQP
jgi:hypothetical protein